MPGTIRRYIKANLHEPDLSPESVLLASRLSCPNQTVLALAGDKINDLAGLATRSDFFKDVLAIANPSRLAASRIWCPIVGVKRRPATDTSCVAQTGSLVAYANCAAESFNPGRT